MLRGGHPRCKWVLGLNVQSWLTLSESQAAAEVWGGEECGA